MLKVSLPVNDKQKQKLKKNALDFVNYEEEKKNDPKYKTELCKSFRDTNFCPYGNRCRFAHGKKELFIKNLDTNKYKQKQCNSFKESGYCLYGSRCNFKHGEAKLDNINRSYYAYMLKVSYTEDYLNSISLETSSESFYRPFVLNKETFFQKTSCDSNSKRLDVFANLTKNAENTSTSVSSNDSFSPAKQVESFCVPPMQPGNQMPFNLNQFLVSSATAASINNNTNCNVNNSNNHRFNNLSFGQNFIGFGLCGKNASNGNSPIGNSNVNTFIDGNNYNKNNNNCNVNFSNAFLNQTGFFPASFLNKTSAV